MVNISCSGKFHAFALAEQMSRRAMLNRLFTTYASGKNTVLAKYVKRVDKENIPTDKISTNTVLGFPVKLLPGQVHRWNNWYDKWVAGRLRNSGGKVFIGWSGMSLHSILRAKELGMVTIVERGSSHICYQNRILQEEYKTFGRSFSIHPAVIKKEMAEYEAADYISVPSGFARDSFLEYGIDKSKLFLNNYGADTAVFKSSKAKSTTVFTIVYLGTISVQKGLVYFFRALHMLDIPLAAYKVVFIGKVDEEMKPVLEQYRKENWELAGHVNYYDLPDYLSQCDVAIQPSLQEGLSMVIPQLMASGIPVIASTNTGGADIIKDGVDGFIVPVRDPAAIAVKIDQLFHDPSALATLRSKAAAAIQDGYSWNDYGERYASFIKQLLQ